jgi:hypothetical protein
MGKDGSGEWWLVFLWKWIFSSDLSSPFFTCLVSSFYSNVKISTQTFHELLGHFAPNSQCTHRRFPKTSESNNFASGPFPWVALFMAISHPYTPPSPKLISSRVESVESHLRETKVRPRNVDKGPTILWWLQSLELIRLWKTFYTDISETPLLERIPWKDKCLMDSEVPFWRGDSRTLRGTPQRNPVSHSSSRSAKGSLGQGSPQATHQETTLKFPTSLTYLLNLPVLIKMRNWGPRKEKEKTPSPLPSIKSWKGDQELGVV